MRDAVGVDRDQADRALALERAEPLDDACVRQAETAARGRHFSRNEIAVLRISVGAGWYRQLPAELLLVDRREPSAARRQRPVDAEHAGARAVDDLDDAAAVADRTVFAGSLLDAQ